MSGHEARINDALKTLGEEYRLGMVALEEYRTRRRMLLESWGERDSTTAPGSASLRSLSSSTVPRSAVQALPAAPAAAPPPPKKSAAALIVAGIAALLLAVGGWFVLSHRAAPPAANPARSAMPAVAPPSEAVVSIKKSADAFLSRNNWDPATINEFVVQWQALTPEDRARALEEPSLRTLRYELEQNLQAETQLVAPDAPPEQRGRLDALTRFKNELGGA